MKKSLVVLILLLQPFGGIAQSGFYVSGFPGFVVPHRSFIPHMAAHTIGAEAGFFFRGTGNVHRDSILKGLDWGFSLYYNHLGKPDINGDVWAITPYLQALLKKHKNSKTYLRIGTGLGYFTKKFDPVTNTKNRAVSNRLNTSMLFTFLNYRKISSDFSFYYGVGLTHFSNANYSRPNLGVNTPQINLGLMWDNPKKQNRSKDTSALVGESFFEIRAAFGVKEATVADPGRFGVYTLGLTQGIARTPVRFHRIGFDVFYDRLNAYELFKPATAKNVAIKDALEVGLRLGIEHDFGSVTTFFDVGFYLYKPPNVGKLPSYISAGVNYHLGRFNTGIRLKSHAAHADFNDYGLAMRLKTPCWDKEKGRKKK